MATLKNYLKMSDNKIEAVVDALEDAVFDLSEDRVHDTEKELSNIITYLRKTFKMTEYHCYNVPNKLEDHCNGTSFTKLIRNKTEYLLYCDECSTEYRGTYKIGDANETKKRRF